MWIIIKEFLVGSACDSVGREVAKNTKDPRFESSHRRNFINLFSINCIEKTKNKEKEAGNGTFLKKTSSSRTNSNRSRRPLNGASIARFPIHFTKSSKTFFQRMILFCLFACSACCLPTSQTKADIQFTTRVAQFEQLQLEQNIYSQQLLIAFKMAYSGGFRFPEKCILTLTTERSLCNCHSKKQICPNYWLSFFLNVGNAKLFRMLI